MLFFTMYMVPLIEINPNLSLIEVIKSTMSRAKTLSHAQKMVIID